MVVARAYCYKRQTAGDRDRACAIDASPVAELAVAVQSPTVRHTRAADAAGAVSAGVHGPERKATADCHGTTGIRLRERPAAELAEVVSPPAICGTRTCHRAGELPAGVYRGECQAARHLARLPRRG